MSIMDIIRKALAIMKTHCGFWSPCRQKSMEKSTLPPKN
jgi:hypothetical protein